MATIDEIIADAREARHHLADLLQELQEEIDEIRFRAFKNGRELTAEEQATRNTRRAEKAEAQAAYIEMTFVTLQRLNESEEVKKLSQRMDEINKELADDLSRLKQIERYAQIAAKVADGVAKVAEKMADIAA